MKTRNQVKRYGPSHIERPKYGALNHYWLKEMLPFVQAAACMMVVLDNYEKAHQIFNEAVQAWGRKDCKSVVSEVDKYITPSHIDRYVDYFIKGNKESDLDYPFEELEKKYRNSPDFTFLIGRINEFIRMGFNRKSDIASGKLKVMPSQDYMLFYAVFVGSLAFFFEGSEDYEKKKIIDFMGHTLDISRIYEGTSKNRLHRFRTKSYGNLRWKRRYDRKIREKAELWYKCRVVYAGPTESCRSRDFTSEETPDPNDIDKAIRDYDLAVGYPRGNAN